MDITVFLIIFGTSAAFIALAAGYWLKLRKNYKNYYKLLWKDSSAIKSSDILGERPFNNYYFEREYDILLRRLLERRRNTLITGSALSGKSYAVFHALKNLNKGVDVLSTRPVAMPHFRIPPDLHFWKDKLIFIDDLRFYVERQDNFHLLFNSAKENNIPVITACNSGHEMKVVKNKMVEQNIDFDNIFGDDIIEFEKLETNAGKEIAGKLGQKWNKVKFNGTIGSISMRLSEMESRFDKCDNNEKTILRVLRNLHLGGINEEIGIFNIDRIKKAAKTYKLEGEDFEWSGWFKSLEDKDFIKIKSRNKLWAEDAYLEHIVKPPAEKSDLEIFEELTWIFSDTPEALLMMGERIYDNGVIDILIADYMKIAINVFKIALNANISELMKLKAKQYLGKSYWSLSKAENTLENCRHAISYFNEVLKSVDRTQMPFEYANIKSKIGNTFAVSAEADRKAENCKIAIEAYKDALDIFSQSGSSVEFARINNNLGGAYLTLADAENPAENLKLAVKCFKKALEVRTINEYPKDYSITKNNLANTYTKLSVLENPVYYLKLAISSYGDALTVISVQKSGQQFGVYMNNLGNAYRYLAVHENKKQNLEKAIQAYEKALEVRTIDNVPLQYSNTISSLGDASLDLFEAGNETMFLDKAINSFKEALKIRTFKNSPLLYGKTQYLLGKAYLKLAAFDDKSENYTRAIKAFDESLRVFNEQNNPEMFNLIQYEITRAKKIFFL